MKKLLIALVGLSASSWLYAAPVLNPAEPALLTDGTFACNWNDCLAVKFGYRGDFVYNRYFSNGTQSLGQFQFWANEGSVTLNLWDRIDITGFVGAVNYDIDTVIADGTGALNYLTAYSQAKDIWGFQVKAVLWETCWGVCGTTYVGIEGTFEGWNRSGLDRVTLGGANVAPNAVGYRYREGQVSLGLAHRIRNLVPYIAAKWSQARGTVSTTRVGAGGTVTTGADLFNGHNRNRHWGYAFGVTLVDAARMDVTAEARFVDEKALSVAANIRF